MNMALIRADDLDTSPVQYLDAGGIIPRTGHGIIWGKSTAGKSLVALDLALAVANDGAGWLGHDILHHGSVAYLLGEGLAGFGVRTAGRLGRQQADTRAAITAAGHHPDGLVAKTMLASLPAYSAERLYVQTDPFACHFDRTERPAPGMRQAVAQLSALPDLELVVIDALADFTGQLSLSNNASAGRINQGMRWMASELDCFVLAVAHPTEDGRKMLGAGRLFNSADVVIEVTPDDSPQDGRTTATISSRKNKEDAAWEPFSYAIEPCQWTQPAEDPETGEVIPGETVVVKSATVRRIEQAAEPAAAARQPAPLPVLQAVPQSRKRNGIRRGLQLAG
jgi:hypothetical protein